MKRQFFLCWKKYFGFDKITVLTDTAFGNNVVIYLDAVSRKDLQIKLELLRDRKNGITEHLETSFEGSVFSKIFHLMQVLKALLCRPENAKYIRN